VKYILFLLLLLIPIAFADIRIVAYDNNQPLLIYDGTITIQNLLFQNVVENATLQIQPNPITQLNSTAYYSHSSSGWYFYRLNTSDGVYYGSGYANGDNTMSAIAIVLALLGMCAYVIYVSKDLLNLPKPKVEKEIYKFIRPENISVFLYMIGSGLIVVLLYFLHQISIGQTYERVLEMVFIGGMWVFGAFVAMYLFLYLLFLAKEHLFGVWKK